MVRTRNSKIMEANVKKMVKDKFKSRKIKKILCKVCHSKIGVERGEDRGDQTLKLFKKITKYRIVCKNCGAINSK